MNMHGEAYISLPMGSLNFGQGYLLRSLQRVDAASGRVQSILSNVFLLSGFAALMAAFALLCIPLDRWFGLWRKLHILNLSALWQAHLTRAIFIPRVIA